MSNIALRELDQAIPLHHNLFDSTEKVNIKSTQKEGKIERQSKKKKERER